jgi:HAD superfamily hydrolase (TIGR01509 family)
MAEAILFDLFETLITESGTQPAGVSSLGPALGCAGEAFRARWKAYRAAVMLGRLSFREALGQILVDLGKQPDEAEILRVAERRIRTKAMPFNRVEPDVLAVVRDLRSRGLRLGVVSNCFAEDVVAWARSQLASHFGCSVFSFEVHVAKPDREIYVEAARRLNVDVGGTWFVGDGMHDELQGARAAGLRAFRALWFLDRWPTLRDDQQSIGGLARPAELVKLVDESRGRPTGG